MSTGPLAGVRVIELAGIGPGPFCGMLLADLGADVVRIAGPARATTRAMGIAAERDPLNRGKRSVTLDLKQPGDLATALSLVECADILFEGFRPGVAERLGIGPEVCCERRPTLVYGRMTGWGQHGPLAHTAGHDIAYIAPTGALHAMGQEGGPPQIPLNLAGDLGGGSLYLAVGMLAALHEARASGRGQVVDAAIVDGAAHLMTPFYSFFANGTWRDERGTNLIDGGAPFYGVYLTSDEKYMAVGALEPQFFAEFASRLGLDQIDNHMDRESWSGMRDRIAAAFRQRTQAEWADIFGESDACVAPVLSLAEAPGHRHLAARNTFIEHGDVVQPAPAPRFSRSQPTITRPPSVSGHLAGDVLDEWMYDGASAAARVSTTTANSA